MKNVIVTLWVVRGKNISYTVDGKVQNDNQTVKLRHDTVEWTNFMKHLHTNGFGKVEVKDAVSLKPDGSTEQADVEAIATEVRKAFQLDTKKPKTSDELEVERMKAEIEELKSIVKGKGTKAKTEAKKVAKDEPKEEAPKDESKGDLDAIKAEYEELFGKKPFHGWKEDVLKEKIAAKKAE